MTYEFFTGGEIHDEFRGDLALIVTGEGEKREVFLEKVQCPAYNHLTGVRSINYLPLRVYAGVNGNGADDNLIGGLQSGEITLEQADERLVIPTLLQRRREARRAEMIDEINKLIVATGLTAPGR